jgi:hypothetical protein
MVADINIKIKPEIGKIIDSCKEDRESKEKRKDLEKEREIKEATNLVETIKGHPVLKEFIKKQGDIMKE